MYDMYDMDDLYDQWSPRELADRLLPATKQQGTKVTPILVTRNTNTNTKQPGTKVFSSEIKSPWPNFISGDCPGRHMVGRAQAGRCLRTSSSASCRGKNFFLLRSELFCQFSISINFRLHVMLACYLHPKHDLRAKETKLRCFFTPQEQPQALQGGSHSHIQFWAVR